MNDMTQLVRIAVAETEAALADAGALEPADWHRPTRLPGWTVRDLVAHLSGLARFAAAVEDVIAGRPASLGASTGPEGDPDAVLAVFREAARRLLGALSRLDAGSLPPPAHGGVPPERLLGLIALEVALHHNDLLWALGDEVPLPRAAAAEAIERAALLAQYAMRGQEQPEPPVAIRLRGSSRGVTVGYDGTRWSALADDQPVQATVSGDDSAVGLFVFGRITADHPWLTVGGDAELARRFKDYVPGP